jgi:hypothetical protein
MGEYHLRFGGEGAAAKKAASLPDQIERRYTPGDKGGTMLAWLPQRRVL